MWLARVASTLLGLSLVLTATAASARCDPTTDPDRSDIANARAAADAVCAGSCTLLGGGYARCAEFQIDAVLVNRGCRSRVKKCVTSSTCGKDGKVTCCRTVNGKPKCNVTKPATCARKGGTSGSCSSCCDACPVPGSGPSCPLPSTTIEPSSTTTTSSVTTTTSVGGGTVCCKRTTTCGPFDTCEVTPPGGICAGFPLGPGDCSGPAPCAHATTTTPPSACCLPGQCVFTGVCECGQLGGQFMFFTTCSPNPCVTTTTLP
jgi:hypothetical protein